MQQMCTPRDSAADALKLSLQMASAWQLLNKRFDCKDEVILTPESALAFFGFDSTCRDYDPDEVKGLNPMNELQVNKHGKIRVRLKKPI